MAQTKEFMLQNVTYRPTVYKTGHLPLANLIIGIENQILADLEKYIVYGWRNKLDYFYQIIDIVSTDT
jgi:hypothetical protein